MERHGLPGVAADNNEQETIMGSCNETFKNIIVWSSYKFENKAW